MDLDVEKVEAAEKSLDEFINKRSRERREANALEETWAETARRENEKRRNRNRWAWIRYHGDLHRAYTKRAAEHAQKRATLLREAGCDDPEAA